jgi:transcriptional regulator with XRE-family HTH domain
MSQDMILLLGDKIKTKRSNQRIKVEQLAEKAGVSKGLISQIENNRSVPSLPVLFNIIHSLGEDLKTFFESMHEDIDNGKVLLIRKGEETKFKKEPVKGFSYKRILTKTIVSQTTDVILLELEKGATRKQMITTDAFECKYLLKGQIEYLVGTEKFILNAGDTIFFDGRLKHKLRNTGQVKALILVIYYF